MAENELEELTEKMLECIGSYLKLKPADIGSYAQMHWPKLLPLMHLHARSYHVDKYGSIFAMNTHVAGDMMDLATIVCTPNAGGDVPVLLIDIMKMKQKQAVFVEYYDCTENGAEDDRLQKVKQTYDSLEDYAEKPAWYVKERTKDSLIKGGRDWESLKKMAAASMHAYAEMAASHPQGTCAAENQHRLNAFIDRMVKEGNPSSSIMMKVMGKEEAEHFFRTVIMPESWREGGEKI
jgi:hypothetical protein